MMQWVLHREILSLIPYLDTFINVSEKEEDIGMQVITFLARKLLFSSGK